jgi:hypothetical protein
MWYRSVQEKVILKSFAKLLSSFIFIKEVNRWYRYSWVPVFRPVLTGPGYWRYFFKSTVGSDALESHDKRCYPLKVLSIFLS